MTGLHPEDEQPVEQSVQQFGPDDPPEVDGVQEAGEESFPASDPPAAWSGPGGG